MPHSTVADDASITVETTLVSLSITDRAEFAMSAVRHRIEMLVENGCLVPFTETDLAAIVANWSRGGDDFDRLYHYVSLLYARAYV